MPQVERKRWIVWATLLVLAAPAAVAEHDQAAMEAWVEAMTPGERHAELADQAGEWRYTVSIWEEPDGEPHIVDGVSVKTLIMGGRYLHEELSGEWMGRPFRGIGITGYDNVTREYVAIWLDNMSTGIQLYTGQGDGRGKQTFRSTMHDPLTRKPIPMRSVGRVIDRDHHTFESYMRRPDGTEFLHMRVEYTRAG